MNIYIGIYIRQRIINQKRTGNNRYVCMAYEENVIGPSLKANNPLNRIMSERSLLLPDKLL
jgi:hypothetical protein